MNVMLLAAGRGTRLRSVEPNVPKALVDIGGEPLLAHQLRYLEKQGVSRVVINAHHLADQVLRFAREHSGSLEIVVVVEENLLGTAGGLRNALPQLGDNAFIVLYGDVLISDPLAPLIQTHVEHGASATLAAYKSDDTDGKGTIVVDERDRVTAFAEKVKTAGNGPALINAGIYAIEPSFANRIPRGRELDFGRDVFPAALSRGERLAIHRLSAEVLDVGTPAALSLARQRHADN